MLGSLVWDSRVARWYKKGKYIEEKVTKTFEKSF
jgi:hypothetical protein